jgi:peptidoglycan/LPS O-acetylase OafA/YrhL
MIPRINNFDLIRLLAALQVVLSHGVYHLKIDGPFHTFYERFAQYFPGVPIFFTISGFLIFWSFDRKPALKQYVINRVLRLYPALYACLGVTVVLLAISSSVNLFTHKEFYGWLFTQMTFLQFYTPEILRFWGVGTPNGSLWTIAVEVQFYIAVPIIYFLIKKFKGAFVLALVFGISIAINIALASLEDNIFKKLGFVSVLPYLFNFMLGSMVYLYWNKIHFIFENKFWQWLLVYLLYIAIFSYILDLDINSYYITSPLHILTPILLCFLVMSLAFSHNNISHKILRENDISYGVYIYHMVVINIFIQFGLIGDSFYLVTAFITTLTTAYLSWVIIEKRSLKLKKYFAN